MPDVADPRVDAAGINAITGARLTAPPDEDAKRAIGAMLPDPFAAWGGADRSHRPYAADVELTRLALVCSNLDVLAATALFAVRGLEQAFDYREAAARSAAGLEALAAGGRIPEIQLRRAAAEVCGHVGDAERLKRIYARAADMGDDPSQPNDDWLARAQFRLRHGGYLAQQGHPETALEALTGVLTTFEALGDRRSRAVTLLDIARIKTAKGEVDEALDLHPGALQIFEALGDRRSRAVTLGDIARIKTAKGEVDEALDLHQEQPQISRRWATVAAGGALGDTSGSRRPKARSRPPILTRAVVSSAKAGDERAVTLGDIAGIKMAKGEVDEASISTRAVADLPGAGDAARCGR